MKRLTYLAALFLFSGAAYAQDNSYESLSRLFSQTNPQGTARMQAMGGTHSAIGADISNISGNPAGLGFYTRSELSISPMFSMRNNASQYINNTQNGSANQFALGNFGVVFASKNRNPIRSSGWQGGAFGISYSRQNMYKNAIRFGDRNNLSSITDFYAETANNEASGGVTSNAFKSDLNQYGREFNYPTSMYYYGLLIDPSSQNGYPYVGTGRDAVTGERLNPTNQSFTSNSTGYTNHWNFSYGANYLNKLYVGVGLGLNRLNYTNSNTISETFVELPNAPLGGLSGFSNTTDLTTTGRGFNLSAGLVYRPSDAIRLGFSVTSPTWYTLNETLSRTQQTSLIRSVEVSPASFPEFENPIDVDGNRYNRTLPQMLQSAGFGISSMNGVSYINSIPTLTTYPLESRYKLRTPTKLSGGVGVFFGKNGFISADAEYVNYRGMKLSGNANESDADFENGYYTNVIKNTYRNVVNLKIGGEYRLDKISLRAGVSYYQDPFQQIAQFNNLDRSRYVYSAGVGYRTDRFYIDAAVTHSQQTTAYSPYVLANANDYASAKIKNQTTNAILTLGTYF